MGGCSIRPYLVFDITPSITSIPAVTLGTNFLYNFQIHEWPCTWFITSSILVSFIKLMSRGELIDKWEQQKSSAETSEPALPADRRTF